MGINSCSLDCTCGNRQCDYDLGESVANCMSDCACNANYDCEPWEDEKNCPRDCGISALYGYGYDDMNGGEYDSEISDVSDSENCNTNGESCTDNFDCCSSACDMNSCVG